MESLKFHDTSLKIVKGTTRFLQRVEQFENELKTYDNALKSPCISVQPTQTVAPIREVEILDQVQAATAYNQIIEDLIKED